MGDSEKAALSDFYEALSVLVNKHGLTLEEAKEHLEKAWVTA